MVLDALFIAVFDWGLIGAAAATATSQFIGGAVPIIYFATSDKSTLKFCKTRAYWRVLLNACINGSSELLSNISASVVTILYNFQLLRFAGENGIAAYGVVMYVAFVFVAIFIGFVIGAGPIVSFHYGANNTDELKSIRKKSTILVLAAGAAMLIVAILLSRPLCTLFVGYDSALYEITLRGFIIYAVSYLFAGFNIFGSSFFTALNNGLISAVISFLRTLVFQTSTVILLPLLFSEPLDGVWFSVIVAEALACAVTAFFIILNKKKYNY